MKVIKKIKPIEVKRTFVISDHIAHVHKGKKFGNNHKFLKDLSEKDFHRRLSDTKKKILKIKERNLDKLISPEYSKRIDSYNSFQWSLVEFDQKEIGVWKRAGGLPLKWTNGSLSETAEKVKKALENNSKFLKRRTKHSIPNILKLKTHLRQSEKYLYPIIFKSNTGTQGRRGLKKKLLGDIDDGCMRSIALAISGKNPIRAYFGTPKLK